LACCRRSAVLGDDLLEGLVQYSPREDLDVLLDVPRLGGTKAHNDLEELLALGLGLADGDGMETLEVSTDAVLLFDGEARRWCCDELFEEVDSIHRRHKELLLLSPVNTTDKDAVRGSLVDADRPEGALQLAAVL
jgi:hypothetical protein